MWTADHEEGLEWSERRGEEERDESCQKDAKKAGDRQQKRGLEQVAFSWLLVSVTGQNYSSPFFLSLSVSLSLTRTPPPLHGVKDKADRPNCVAGPCSQQWPFEANFPAHGAEKDRERRTESERDRGTRRRVEG